MKILQTFGIGATPSSNIATLTQPTQQVSISDLTNIRYARTFVLNNGFVVLSHSNIAAGIALSDLALALVTLEPTLTWPPVALTQPISVTVTSPTPANFSFIISSEVSVVYQWQVSTDAGNTWNPTVDGMGGPYTGSATYQLVVSPSTGLNGKQYRCYVTNVAGNVTSNAAILTVN